MSEYLTTTPLKQPTSLDPIVSSAGAPNPLQVVKDRVAEESAKRKETAARSNREHDVSQLCKERAIAEQRVAAAADAAAHMPPLAPPSLRQSIIVAVVGGFAMGLVFLLVQPTAESRLLWGGASALLSGALLTGIALVCHSRHGVVEHSDEMPSTSILWTCSGAFALVMAILGAFSVFRAGWTSPVALLLTALGTGIMFGVVASLLVMPWGAADKAVFRRASRQRELVRSRADLDRIEKSLQELLGEHGRALVKLGDETANAIRNNKATSVDEPIPSDRNLTKSDGETPAAVTTTMWRRS